MDAERTNVEASPAANRHDQHDAIDLMEHEIVPYFERILKNKLQPQEMEVWQRWKETLRYARCAARKSLHAHLAGDDERREKYTIKKSALFHRIDDDVADGFLAFDPMMHPIDEIKERAAEVLADWYELKTILLEHRAYMATLLAVAAQ